MSDLPSLIDLDFSTLPLVHGFYTLGLIKKYRPDISMLFLRLARNDQWNGADLDPNLLYDKIKSQLRKNKKVFVVPFDEYVMDVSYDFSSVLNDFTSEPVYFVTEMDQEQSKYWTFQKKLKCKILELPFILVNDAICYYHVRQKIRLKSPPQSRHNFLCMINRSETCKYDLCKAILDLGLASHGMITYRDQNAPRFITENFLLNKSKMLDPGSLPTLHRQEAGQIYVENVMVSSNVHNYFEIEQLYDMPLIINPESTVGIFPNTEKSLWPSLLGRMYLIYGHQHIMSWIQRFCDYQPENFCDLSFDMIQGYTPKDHATRLETMLSNNRDLIINAREIYEHHKDKLQKGRWRIVENLYVFFDQQLQTIR